MNTNNIVNKILGTTIKLDKISLNKKRPIPHNCFYCDEDLYHDKNGKNFVYHKGKYICLNCFYDKVRRKGYE